MAGLRNRRTTHSWRGSDGFTLSRHDVSNGSDQIAYGPALQPCNGTVGNMEKVGAHEHSDHSGLSDAIPEAIFCPADSDTIGETIARFEVRGRQWYDDHVASTIQFFTRDDHNRASFVRERPENVTCSGRHEYGFSSIHSRNAVRDRSTK